KDPKTKAIRLFYAVRDNIQYDPYTFNLKPDQLKASYVLKQKKTYCVPKAVLMTSVIRAAGIPARLGYANLINHTISNDLKTILNTNVLAWHGYTEVYLKDSWIRITPAFNVELCKYLNVPPVEFDGESHAIFPSADNDGNKHMEYIEYHGTFDDVPLETIVKSMMEHYPMLMKHDELVP
ncbi:MAG: transglutaminase domain-containing protein, partial [Candidatus Magnetoglobus multicellularis str. Araruama]